MKTKIKLITTVNEIYAIHFNGELLAPDVWGRYSKNYRSGGRDLTAWRPPKKMYHKLGHAKSAFHHLPDQIKPDCKIVRYGPIEEIEIEN